MLFIDFLKQTDRQGWFKADKLQSLFSFTQQEFHPGCQLLFTARVKLIAAQGLKCPPSMLC